jgi:hypothetical protein
MRVCTVGVIFNAVCMAQLSSEAGLRCTNRSVRPELGEKSSKSSLEHHETMLSPIVFTRQQRAQNSSSVTSEVLMSCEQLLQGVKRCELSSAKEVDEMRGVIISPVDCAGCAQMTQRYGHKMRRRRPTPQTLYPLGAQCFWSRRLSGWCHWTTNEKRASHCAQALPSFSSNGVRLKTLTLVKGPVVRLRDFRGATMLQTSSCWREMATRMLSSEAGEARSRRGKDLQLGGVEKKVGEALGAQGSFPKPCSRLPFQGVVCVEGADRRLLLYHVSATHSSLTTAGHFMLG